MSYRKILHCAHPAVTMFGRQLILIPIAIVLVLGSASALGDLDYFRAIYDGDWNYSLLGRLGFDAVYEPMNWRSGVDELYPRIEEETLEAAANGMFYIPEPRYRPRPEFNFTYAVNEHGAVQESTPSPLDEEYWIKYMEEPGVAIANLSLAYPVWGIVWDMEVYYRHWKWKEWTYYSYTYDSDAIRRFAEEKDEDIPDLPASERREWLETRGLLDDYQLWQEETVRGFARRTAERIREINPDLYLGTLGYQDVCWWFLSILEGFSCEERPVMAWHEDTYGGYGTQEINDNHDAFAERRMNAKVIPGLWTYQIPPFKLLMNMESAARYEYASTPDGEFWTTYNGSFWIFPRGADPWRLGTESGYIKAFELLETQIYFNQSTPNPLPKFCIYPGVEIQPHRGPDGISAILNPWRTEDGEQLPPLQGLAFSDVELSPGIEYLNYVNVEMEEKSISEPQIPLEELPCIIWGLEEADLERTMAWGKIHELEDLASTYGLLGLDDIPGLSQSLESSKKAFREGNYRIALETAEEAANSGYGLVMEAVWPFVEQGFDNPRNSTVPMVILNKIYSADRMLKEGETSKGRAYLLKALNDWSEIPESLGVIGPGFALLALYLWGGMRGRKPGHGFR